MDTKITKRAVDQMVTNGRDVLSWDADVKGFGVRCRSSGAKFYVLKMRVGGRQRWITIGRHGSPWTPETAQSEQKAVIKFTEPPALACDPEKPATLVELRIGGSDKGAQTLFPGSMHPSGEPIEWVSDGEPKHVDGGELKRCVGALAAAALLVRHYPATGVRHDAALVLGGMLARIPDWDAGDIQTFVEAIARAANDDEAQERGRSAAGAVDLLQRGDPTPGLPRMRDLWGTELAILEYHRHGLDQAADDLQQLLCNDADLRKLWSNFTMAGGIFASDLSNFIAGRLRYRRIRQRRHLRLVTH